MKRIYHHYKLWEDQKEGFYKSVKNKNNYKDLVISFFNNEEDTGRFMSLVLDKWVVSCEQNLSNLSMNRVAWIGQAACFINNGTPSLTTMYFWKFLDYEVQERANKQAIKAIKLWEQKQKSKVTSRIGRLKDTKKGYQMKLLLN